MKEQWKPYTGEYKELCGVIMVSNMGNIYRIEKGETNSIPKLLKNTISNRGYASIHISINGKSYKRAVHRIVADVFCDKSLGKEHVDHINAIRDDNRAENLRWVNHSENCNNPIYLEKLSKRMSKPVRLIHMDGSELYFEKLNDVKKAFNTKSNLSRKIEQGGYFTSRKSKLYGYKIVID